MKAIVSGKLKAQVSLPTGEITVNLEGGKTFQGVLTNEELSQIAFLVATTSKGEVTFDPPGEDLLARHVSDKTTIEKQTGIIEKLRGEVKTLTERVNLPTAELQAKIEKLEKDLKQARDDKQILADNLALTANELVETRQKFRDLREQSGLKETPEAKPADTKVAEASTEASQPTA